MEAVSKAHGKIERRQGLVIQVLEHFRLQDLFIAIQEITHPARSGCYSPLCPWSCLGHQLWAVPRFKHLSKLPNLLTSLSNCKQLSNYTIS